MSGLTLSKFPTPLELALETPLKDEDRAFIDASRHAIASILSGLDKRLLLIIGPCSLHDPNSALEYADRLKQLSDRVSDRIFIVMRTYFEKPRSIIGWKGLLFDPDLDGSHQIEKGVRLSRELLLELACRKIPCGSEVLEPFSIPYLAEFLSWGCVGARTCASQPHRQLASYLPFPIGFKNSTDGNIILAVQGMMAASLPHTFLGILEEGIVTTIESEGNASTHLILRGGAEKPNYDMVSVQSAIDTCLAHKVSPRLIIDCSHDNCGKDSKRQAEVFHAILDQIKAGNDSIIGLMLESHLFEGKQSLNEVTIVPGISVTDPCIGWAETEGLVLSAYSCYDSII